ncbi:hypothetical protein GCM10027610_110080 [Dactylosporangium cerinum]
MKPHVVTCSDLRTSVCSSTELRHRAGTAVFQVASAAKPVAVSQAFGPPLRAR